MSNNYRFETLSLHAGTRTRSYYKFPSCSNLSDDLLCVQLSRAWRKSFWLKEFGNIYTRIMNPTTDVFEKRIAALEGGVACRSNKFWSSGSILALNNILEAGDNLISTTYLYGGTL